MEPSDDQEHVSASRPPVPHDGSLLLFAIALELWPVCTHPLWLIAPKHLRSAVVGIPMWFVCMVPKQESEAARERSGLTILPHHLCPLAQVVLWLAVAMFSLFSSGPTMRPKYFSCALMDQSGFTTHIPHTSTLAHSRQVSTSFLHFKHAPRDFSLLHVDVLRAVCCAQCGLWRTCDDCRVSGDGVYSLCPMSESFVCLPERTWTWAHTASRGAK